MENKTVKLSKNEKERAGSLLPPPVNGSEKRGRAAANEAPPYQPAGFEYRDKKEGKIEITHRLSVIPAKHFPIPVGDNEIDKTIENAINQYSYNVPRNLYGNGTKGELDKLFSKDQKPISNTIVNTLKKKPEIRILAKFFGYNAFAELFSRMRWAVSDFEGSPFIDETIVAQRLMLHIPGHFRELARNYPDYKDAFVLENLGWILMYYIRSQVKEITKGKNNWWIPPTPLFFSEMPAKPLVDGKRLYSVDLENKINKLDLKTPLKKVAEQEYEIKLDKWFSGLPGRHWDWELYPWNERGRFFYPALIKRLKGEAFLKVVSISKERAEAEKAYTNYRDYVKQNVSTLQEQINILETGKDADKFSSKFVSNNITGTKEHPDVKTGGIVMVNDFPQKVEDLVAYPKRQITSVKTLIKLQDVIANLFTTIYELGWNDLIYDNQGAFFFRGVGGYKNSLPPISDHAFGAAMDINPQEQLRGKQNRIGAMDPRIVALFDAFQFKWGAVISRPDPHHFEYRVYTEDEIKAGKTIEAVQYI